MIYMNILMEVNIMFAIRPVSRGYSYDPFRAMDAFQRSFFEEPETFMSRSFMHEFKTDIRSEGDSIILDTDLPGFAKEDISVELNGDTLTISAERSSHNDENAENGGYIRRERSFGKYTRSFDISEIDADNIRAAYENGVLTLTMPKKQAVLPETRKLEIM